MSLIHRRLDFNSGLGLFWTYRISWVVEKLSISFLLGTILMSINSDDIIVFYDLLKKEMKDWPPANGKYKCCRALLLEFFGWHYSLFHEINMVSAILKIDMWTNGSARRKTCGEKSFGLNLWSIEYMYFALFVINISRMFASRINKASKSNKVSQQTL